MSEQINSSRDYDELSFREGMAELDNIVAQLESNSLELEESLEAYEKGVGLLRNLRMRLDKAQQKVDVLMGEIEQTESDDIIDSTLQKA